MVSSSPELPEGPEGASGDGSPLGSDADVGVTKFLSIPPIELGVVTKTGSCPGRENGRGEEANGDDGGYD